MQNLFLHVFFHFIASLLHDIRPCRMQGHWGFEGPSYFTAPPFHEFILKDPLSSCTGLKGSSFEWHCFLLYLDDPRRGLVKKHLAWPRFIALDPAQFNKVQKKIEDSRSRWRIIAHSIVFSALASIALSCRCGTGYVFSMFCKLWWRCYDSKAWIRIVILCLIWTIFGHTLFTLGCTKYDILAWSI